ncbi:hypothetical protein HX122_06090 [Acinetobacter towneri]|uniref:type I-Fv CRISPR-associated protein Cas7fv n=1 Tax=Acinetobacter towneri TaxID=202956 RepID=UPI002575F1DF|nr:type I-Fv CRISPR-associated protein Cas7fv [Acinetobacter towneri]MDM1754546.1 hypothetical protein [Acinetobacter towneri]
MAKVTGLKSVDFKITAYGYGVVNWNGNVAIRHEGMAKDATNHSVPKLRGYTNLTGEKSEKGFLYKKDPREVDFEKNRLYISQNCIRHHLFKDQTYDVSNAKDKPMVDLLASITGLVRGYVIPQGEQFKRTSALLITDFVDQLGNGNYEQMGRAGSKEKELNKKGEESSNSIFSKITFGDTEYEAYGSISIEQLQFISLDKNFDRAAMIVDNKDNTGEKIAQRIQDFIKSLDPSREPKAVFNEKYARKGSIYKEYEAGILLDNTAIDILVKETLAMLEELVIKQAKGYMCVDTVEVDYNDSHKMMRIKQRKLQSQVNSEPQTDYAIYYEVV